MATWVPALLVGIVLGVLLRIGYRSWRKSRVVERRVVEAPNSHYSSEGVRNQEARERWGRINQRRLHPLNRDEVQRLLDAVDQYGLPALSPKDKLFLDNMTLPRMG